MQTGHTFTFGLFSFGSFKEAQNIFVLVFSSTCISKPIVGWYFIKFFGVPRIELGLHAPNACVLPIYYTPFYKIYYGIFSTKIPLKKNVVVFYFSYIIRNIISYEKIAQKFRTRHQRFKGNSCPRKKFQDNVGSDFFHCRSDVLSADFARRKSYSGHGDFFYPDFGDGQYRDRKTSRFSPSSPSRGSPRHQKFDNKANR